MDMSRPGQRASIEVKITDRCNQTCLHCANGDGPEAGRDLDWDLFNRRLEEWAAGRETSVCDLREVRLTGGEPLLLLEGVLAVAECCRRLGIKSGINTNGLLLDPGRIRRLKQSGIETVKISLDTMDAAAYKRLRGPLPSLRSLLEKIEELIRGGFRVILRFTLMRENIAYLKPCCRLAGDLGVHKFQIKPLIRSGRAMDPAAFLDNYEIDEALKELADSEAGARTPVEILCWPGPAEGAFSSKACGSIDKIYVSPDSTVSICNFIADHRRSAIGDLTQTSLETVFRDRFDGSRAEAVGGFRIIKGCPNTPFFERAGA